LRDAVGTSHLCQQQRSVRLVDRVEINVDRWPDAVRLSDLEPLFVCQAYGKKGQGSNNVVL
jgi:hypothetical protein